MVIADKIDEDLNSYHAQQLCILSLPSESSASSLAGIVTACKVVSIFGGTSLVFNRSEDLISLKETRITNIASSPGKDRI